jgi:predicted small lipoprotein YifL
MTPRILIPALVMALLGLAACGKQGQLDRPAPLFGAKAKAEYEAQRLAAAKAEADPQSGSAQTNGDFSQDADGGSKDPELAPIGSNPIPGANPSPFGSRPGGVLPDPYADPTRAPR